LRTNRTEQKLKLKYLCTDSTKNKNFSSEGVTQTVTQITRIKKNKKSKSTR
jgi:hypothetical protein